ncbi:MAG: nucleotidyltransferase family protein [Phycisphaerae bacterium]|nr:nucleotidyltransferase family protein [Phycisphaerae bacterium]
MINAIVLAAGRSKRMGKLKPLLRFGDHTFLEHIISVLKNSEVDKITVVLGAEADTIQQSADFSGTNIVINKDYQKGQLSSLITGIRENSEDTDAILLCLVDNPFVTKDVVDEIIGKFKETNSPIIVPVFDKKRGHPTLFSKSLFNELLNAPQDKGARHVLYSNEDKVLELDVNDRGILIGINTEDDYKLHFGVNP